MAQMLHRRALPALAFLLAQAGPALAGGAPPPAPARDAEFVPLGDFTVNLPSVGRRYRYFLVSVTIEVKGDQAQQSRDLLPRLKEAVLQELMQMSARNQLRPGATDPGALRDGLFGGLNRVLGAALRGIVITRMMHS